MTGRPRCCDSQKLEHLRIYGDDPRILAVALPVRWRDSVRGVRVVGAQSGAAREELVMGEEAEMQWQPARIKRAEAHADHHTPGANSIPDQDENVVIIRIRPSTLTSSISGLCSGKQYDCHPDDMARLGTPGSYICCEHQILTD